MNAKPFHRYMLPLLFCFHYFLLSGLHFVFTHMWCRGSVSLEHRPMLLWSFRRSFAIFPRRKPLPRERYFTGAGYHFISGTVQDLDTKAGQSVGVRRVGVLPCCRAVVSSFHIFQRCLTLCERWLPKSSCYFRNTEIVAGGLQMLRSVLPPLLLTGAENWSSWSMQWVHIIL